MSSSEAEQSIFSSALELTASDRRAYLEEACAGEPALRARIERLLAAHERAGGFLIEEPEASVDAETVTSSGPSIEAGHPRLVGVRGEAIVRHPRTRGQRGQVVGGKYTLVEPLGEGGMGTVWRAQQTEPVKRFVAVKLIKAGMDSRQVLARFEAERQALAIMDHPEHRQGPMMPGWLPMAARSSSWSWSKGSPSQTFAMNIGSRPSRGWSCSFRFVRRCSTHIRRG